MEQWKEIEGYEGLYEVSNHGRVRSMDRILQRNNDIPVRRMGKILSSSIKKRNATSYEQVTLFKNNKRDYVSVHRLVAEAFCPRVDGCDVVDHKDCNGQNNHADNLEWVTQSENIQRSFQRNPSIKLAICSAGGVIGGAKQHEAAVKRWKGILANRFIAVVDTFPDGLAIRYQCECGEVRCAYTTARELRYYSGTCPTCRGVGNRSNPSLE